MSRARLRGVPIAAIVAAAAFVVAFGTIVVPWLTRDRQIISSTPTTLPLAAASDLRVGHDGVLCVAGIGLDSDAQTLRFIVHQLGRSTVTPSLRVDIRGPGYRSVSTLASGYVQDYALVLTGTFISILPLLVVFLLLGRQIIGGIMKGAVKG